MDPDNKLEINHKKEGKYQVIDVNLKTPVCNVLINESPDNQIPDSAKTWMGVSTCSQFEELSRALSKDYEKIIHQVLPPLHESVKQAAQDIKSFPDQINKITSLLSEKIRYMGDWRTIHGRYVPRPLKDAAERQVGDCKDFSASTAAILNSMGYKAQVALVRRSLNYLPPEKTLPSLDNFDHAIVKVTAKDGQVFWIDPTNFTSMANGIFPDIAGRPVLVLDSQTPVYETIPAIDPAQSKIILEKTIELKGAGIVSTQGSIQFIGNAAQQITGAVLIKSLGEIKEDIIRFLSDENFPLSSSVNLPDLTSRVVKDIAVNYSYDQENILFVTNVGTGILLKGNWVLPFITASDNQEGTTFIGSPTTMKRKITILNSQIENVNSLAYDFKSPWIEAKRVLRQGDKETEIEEQIIFLKNFITAGEVKTKEYKTLKNLLKQYAYNSMIITSRKK